MAHFSVPLHQHGEVPARQITFPNKAIEQPRAYELSATRSLQTMPTPPQASLFTRYVLENPWPLGISLLVIAAYVLWVGLRDGLDKHQKTGVVLGIGGVAALATGYFVQTSGERARAIVQAFVNAVVNEDLHSADALLADNAALSVSAPNNPAIAKDLIMSSLSEFAARYTVEDNQISAMKSYTESAEQ